ncbi:MAG: tail fiber assembly protein [Enterobacterales bacterium endosymbiont of Blomia tropicalis]|uniref:tail fiber assembly protein n=1 Tax=Mixta mediterraneensis TaxID=2758443 RepID=UPI0025A6B5FF|nr:tail fiber assembly protein [Mixta mediterraneensis]MDL4913726.1 tail fiber assembly protein [Mixta mediterraneensis]
MNNYVWSASNNAFFPIQDLSTYVDAGWNLSDAIDVDDAVYDEFKNSVAGKIRGIGDDGMPCWMNVPPPTRDELIAAAESRKSELLAAAGAAIAPLRDAVDLDIATDDEQSLLLAWKKYRVLLNRIDTSTAPDISWPTQPVDQAS